jgi:single stranded DNA-binding protein
MVCHNFWCGEDGQKKEETTFVDVTFWGKDAEIVQKYVKKGNPLFVEGRLQLDTWEDKTTHKTLQAEDYRRKHPTPTGRPQSEPGVTSPTGRTKPAPDFSRRPSDPEPDDLPY